MLTPFLNQSRCAISKVVYDTVEMMTASRSETAYAGLDGSHYAGLHGTHETYYGGEPTGDIDV